MWEPYKYKLHHNTIKANKNICRTKDDDTDGHNRVSR